MREIERERESERERKEILQERGVAFLAVITTATLLTGNTK